MKKADVIDDYLSLRTTLWSIMMASVKRVNTKVQTEARLRDLIIKLDTQLTKLDPITFDPRLD